MLYYGGVLMQISNIKHTSFSQEGFTLIELMISLVLGLLISAAVVQIYITNVQTSTIQKSGSELQDASVFGIQMLESHIRLANLGNPTSQIDNTTVGGGIVLSAQNIGLAATDVTQNANFTHSEGDTGWAGVSNTNIASDQLTIQFINYTGQTMSDCEGNDINAGEMVIERYFVRAATGTQPADAIKKLVLACDAGRLNLVNGMPSGIKDYPASNQLSFGNAGQEFILGVDQFKVLLGTQTTAAGSAGMLSYLSSNQYLNDTTTPLPKPALVAVKVGMIVNGSTPIMGTDDATVFSVLGNQNTLKTDATRSKKVRTTYESTSLLRNARVINVATGI